MRGSGAGGLIKIMETVFVYGTLKQGQPNSYLLIPEDESRKAVFLGHAITTDLYPLVIGGRYNTPFLLDKPGHGKRIHGEVYSVNGPMLQRLDELENHPTYYQRDFIRVEMAAKADGGPSSEMKTCWSYFLRSYKPELDQFPMLDNFDVFALTADQSYIPPSARPANYGTAHIGDVLLQYE